MQRIFSWASPCPYMGVGVPLPIFKNIYYLQEVSRYIRATSFKLITCWLNKNCLLMGFSINSKHETRNPKQIRMTKIQNSKRAEPSRYWITLWNVLVIWYSKLDIVSSFDIRILKSPETPNIKALALTLTFPCKVYIMGGIVRFCLKKGGVQRYHMIKILPIRIFQILDWKSACRQFDFVPRHFFS